MKRTGLFMLSLLIFSTVIGQLKESPKSKTDIFSEKAGTLIQTETVPIASIKKLSVKVVHLTDLISGNKIAAVKLETTYSNSLGSDTKVGTIDQDEIADVLKSLIVIQDKLNGQPTISTDLIYTTRGGVEIGCFTGDDKKLTWNLYLKVEKYDGNSYVFLDKDQVRPLVEALQAAKEKL
jgi:hypothetical protein